MLFAALIVMLWAGTSYKSTKQTASQGSIGELMGMMKGSFNSAEQEAADSSYYNISLHMYPIWESRDGNWLYVEQALNEMQDKPYRQRIYQIEQTGEQTFRTTVYAINNPDDAIGKWKTPE